MIQEIAQLIERCDQAVGQGAQTAGTTVQAVSALKESMSGVFNLVVTIGTDSEAQAKIGTRVAQQVEQATVEVSLNAGASRELAATVAEVARTAEDLASVADGLSQTIGGFKI